MSALPKKPLPTKHLFSVEDWHRMGEIGFFLPDTRTELIEGEIIDMAPIGSSHAGHVNWLTHFFITQIADSAIVKAHSTLPHLKYDLTQRRKNDMIKLSVLGGFA